MPDWPLHRHRAAGGAGYTLIELIAVLGVIGILAAVVLPRFVSPQSYRDLLLKDQLLSVARLAQQTALSRYGERVCLEVSLSASTPQSWVFEVWAGADDPSVPLDTCPHDTLIKRQTQERAASELLLGTTAIGTTPAVVRYDSLGNLVNQSGNLSFTASGRNVCITLAGYAYSAADGGTCVLN